MSIMGLDFGDKRIGVAISDSLGLTAQGRGVIQRTDLRQDLELIKEYIEDYGVKEIVVGLPRNMDGSYGPRVDKTEEFIRFLENNLELPIVRWDERLSTAEAEKLLIRADLGRARRKGVIDKVAASIILQGYLDYQNRGDKRE